MVKSTCVVDFALKLNEDLISHFMNSKEQSAVYFITITRQVNISDELRMLLIQLINENLTVEEIQKVLNQYCPSEISVHVFEISSFYIQLELTKIL